MQTNRGQHLPANTDIEDMYETLNSRGWDLLCERFEIDFEGCNQALGCSGEQDLFIRHGRLIELSKLLALKETIRDEMNESPAQPLEVYG